MQKTDWTGVIPAITTPFNAKSSDVEVDHGFIKKHVGWLIGNGCTGVVALGSLGEGATLTGEEKRDILRTCREATDTLVIAGVSALSTTEAIQLAQDAKEIGCDGLMVLPPYVYNPGDWDEISAHFSAVIEATDLSCMLYNNPVAYGVDIVPGQMAGLAAKHANLHAVKESSTDVRRVTQIRAELGNRLEIFVGVDDVLLEGVQAGATGWIAGLVNAFPKESVVLYDLAMAGKIEEARKIYDWFLPLLRLDTVPKFVQLIKLVQQEVGMGSPTVRAPRMELKGAELDETMKIIRDSLESRPSV